MVLKTIPRLLGRLGRGRFSLSTRFILSMAGIVILTTVASVVIFNIMINNQTKDLENKLNSAFYQAKDVRKTTEVPAQETIDRIKTIVNDSSLSPETQLAQIRQTFRADAASYYGVFVSILRDTGLPVSTVIKPGSVPGDPALAGVDAGPLIGPGPGPGGPKVAARGIEGNPEARLLSPVVQSSLLGSLVAAICAVLLGLILARTIIKPLKALEKASERIADGNYSLVLSNEGRDDLGRLAASFNKMARTLRFTEQKRKELLADVAHELRTPLASIQGYTEVLRDGLAASHQRQQDMYNHILQEVHHVTRMVDSLRIWMSNEQALERLNVETLPARVPAKMVLDRFKPLAEQSQVKLELCVADSLEEPEITVDSDAIKHALSNLVDNALRYTPAGGTVTLNISAPERIKGQKHRIIWFEVKDSGSGIPAEHLPFVFERFYRVDKSRDRKTGGTGLGLAIVKDTVQVLGGEVTITSQLQKGTSVRFWLPAAVSSGPPSRKLLLAGFRNP
jgi:signal transduction histidine kinase